MPHALHPLALERSLTDQCMFKKASSRHFRMFERNRNFSRNHENVQHGKRKSKGKGDKGGDHDEKHHGHGHKGKGEKGGDDDKHGYKGHKGKGDKGGDHDEKHGHGHKGKGGKGEGDDKKHGHVDKGRKGKGGKGDDDQKKHGHGGTGKGNQPGHGDKHNQGSKCSKRKSDESESNESSSHHKRRHGKGHKKTKPNHHKGHKKPRKGKDTSESSEESVQNSKNKKHSKHIKNRYDESSSSEDEETYIIRSHSSKKHYKEIDESSSSSYESESVDYRHGKSKPGTSPKHKGKKHKGGKGKHPKNSKHPKGDDNSSSEEHNKNGNKKPKRHPHHGKPTKKGNKHGKKGNKHHNKHSTSDSSESDESKEGRVTKRTNHKHRKGHHQDSEEDSSSEEYSKQWHTKKHRSSKKSETDDSSSVETNKHRGKHGKHNRPGGKKGGKPKPTKSPKKLPGHKVRPGDKKKPNDKKKPKEEHKKGKKDKKKGHTVDKGKKRHGSGSSEDVDWQTIVKRRSKKESDDSTYQSSEEYNSFEDDETRIRRRQRHTYRNKHTNSKDEKESDESEETKGVRKGHKSKNDKGKPKKKGSNKPKNDKPGKKTKQPNQDKKGKKPDHKPKGKHGKPKHHDRGNKGKPGKDKSDSDSKEKQKPSKPGKDKKPHHGRKHPKKGKHGKNEKYTSEESEDSYEYTSEEIDSTRKYKGKRKHTSRTYHSKSGNDSDESNEIGPNKKPGQKPKGENDSGDQPGKGKKGKPKDKRPKGKPKDKGPKGKPKDKGPKDKPNHDNKKKKPKGKGPKKGQPGDKGKPGKKDKPDNKKPDSEKDKHGKKPKPTDKKSPKKPEDSDEDNKNEKGNKPGKDHGKPKDKKHKKKKGHLKDHVYKYVKKWNRRHSSEEQNDFEWFFTSRTRRKTSYKKRYHFLKDLTFKDVKKRKMQKKFYSYFHFYPETEDLFELVKFCYQYPEKPENFETNFKITLENFFQEDELKLSTNILTVFLNNLFGKGRENVRNNYRIRHQFLKKLTFKECQKPHNRKRFYFFFKFYPENEDVFNLIKFCFHFSKKPVNFDDNYKAVIEILENNDSIEDTDEIYSVFLKNLHGKGRDNNRRDYKTKFHFLKDLTFDDMQSYENREMFYFYFRTYPKSESFFEFIKFCFSENKKPANFDMNFKAAMKAFRDSESDDISDDIFSIFLNNLYGKGNDNTDKKDGKKVKKDYKVIYRFLRSLTFKDCQKRHNKKKFYSFFRFYPENEELFRFIKFCYRLPRKPTNFDENFKAAVRILQESDSMEMTDDVYSVFLKNLHGKGKDNDRRDYKTKCQFIKDLTFEELQKSPEKKEMFYFYYRLYPKTQSIFDFIKLCFAEDQKPVNFDENFKAAIKAIRKSDSQDKVSDDIISLFYKNLYGKGKDNNRKDYKTQYQFLKDLTFDDCQDYETKELFYFYFRIYPDSEDLFDFIKFCFSHDQKPANFDTNFKSAITAIQDNSLEITDDIYSVFMKDLNGKGKGENTRDYVTKYKFLKEQTYEKVQSYENKEQFYYFFHIYPENEDIFNFFKFCHHYDVKPKNFDENFETVMSTLESSLEINDDTYSIFLKNLFGKGKDNNRRDYKSKHEFLKTLTFQQCQSYEYKETFYYYFRYYPETEDLFNFFKFCYRFSQKPSNFNANFKAAINSLKDSKSHEVTEDTYSLFLNDLFGDGNQNSDDDYLTKHQFLKDLTYQDCQKKENWHLFYALFQFYPETEGIFNFIKFCHQYTFKPANFETNFQASIDSYVNSKSEDVTNEIYKIFCNDLFDFSNQNFGGNYEAKHQFLQTLTFEDCQKTENWNAFYSHFGFYPEKKSWFDFVKHCFEHDQKPANFNFNFDAALSIIFSNYADSSDINSNAYTIFDNNLFGDNGANYNQNGGQSDFSFQFSDYFSFFNDNGAFDEFFSHFPYLNWSHYGGNNNNQNGGNNGNQNDENSQYTYTYNYGNNGDNQNGYWYTYTYGGNDDNQYNYNYGNQDNNDNNNNNGYSYYYNYGNQDSGNNQNNAYSYSYSNSDNNNNNDNNAYSYSYSNSDNNNNNDNNAYSYSYSNSDNNNNNNNNAYSYSYSNSENENNDNNGQSWSRTWTYF